MRSSTRSPTTTRCRSIIRPPPPTSAVANFTGHTFRNLSGDLGSPILDHLVQVSGDKALDVTPALVPNGKLLDVAGTPMDFREAKPFGKDIGADYQLLKAGGGYDNHFVVDQKAKGELRLDARVTIPSSAA